MTAGQALVRLGKGAQRSPRRDAVILVGLLWLILAAPFPPSLDGTGIVVALALVALDVVLGRSTGWLAFARTSGLDERQAADRDSAYRLAFRLVSAGVLLMVALSIAGAFAVHPQINQAVAQVTEGFSARRLAALLELLFIVPTAVIAWFVPDISDQPMGSQRPFQGWAAALSVPLLAIAWFAGVAALPVRSITVSGVPDHFVTDATCNHFAAKKQVGSIFGGTLRLQAEVCWNGQEAFVFGDPHLISPARLPSIMPALTDLTNCSLLDADTDFAMVSQTCDQEVDNNGTMRLTARGRVSPLPGGVGARAVEIQLVVTRDGKVVSFN